MKPRETRCNVQGNYDMEKEYDNLTAAWLGEVKKRRHRVTTVGEAHVGTYIVIVTELKKYVGEYAVCGRVNWREGVGETLGDMRLVSSCIAHPWKDTAESVAFRGLWMGAGFHCLEFMSRAAAFLLTAAISEGITVTEYRKRLRDAEQRRKFLNKDKGVLV